MYPDVMDHHESIYNIIPPKEVVHRRPPMYRSRHNGTIPPTASTFGQAQTSHPVATNLSGEAQEKVVPSKSHRSQGKPPGTMKNDVDSFMKKNCKRGKVATLNDVKTVNPELLQPSQLKLKIKPDIPAIHDKPIMDLVTSKNFVVANAVEAILAAPRKVSAGAKDYIKKKDYGRVPKYLQHIKKDIDAEYEYIRHLQQQEDEARGSQVRPLEAEDQEQLIKNLKAKWEQVNTEYQSSTHLTTLDTVGKVKRKEKYEAELGQIEKDIQKLNKKNIYIDQSYHY